MIITGILEDEVFTDFALHTEPKATDVEFTISCLTRGGPATFVEWATPFGNGTSHETSQLILDPADSVYDNRLLVRGRESGPYRCTVQSNRDAYFQGISLNVTKELVLRGLLRFTVLYTFKTNCAVAGDLSRYYHLRIQQYTCQHRCVLGVTR